MEPLKLWRAIYGIPVMPNGVLLKQSIIHIERNCAYGIVATTQDEPDKVVTHWKCMKCDKTDDITYTIEACATCNTRGGTISGEMQGDGYMTGYVEFFEPCDDCLSNGLCPGCGNATLYEGVFEAAMDDISTFTCEVCGWSFDRERFYDDEPDDEPDYWPEDYEPDYSDERYTDVDVNDNPLMH